jgi:hypothetical protein
VTFGHADVVLWSLRKGEHKAHAELRMIDGSEDELRLVTMGKREVRLFRPDERGLLLAVAREKREELEAMGWRTA